MFNVTVWPVNIKDIRILADNALMGASGMVTGANDDGVHMKNVDIKRDIHIDDWQTDDDIEDKHDVREDVTRPTSEIMARTIGTLLH